MTNKDVEQTSTSATTQRAGQGLPVRNTIDPFAVRPAHTLEWHKLQLTSNGGKKQKQPTEILKGVSGVARPGELTCIMGASGSGKTSLLQTLAGRGSTKCKLEGEIVMDGNTIDPTSSRIQKKFAYIAQTDKLLPTATPREAIRFAARLRLPRDTPEKEIVDLTNRILKELRLDEVADSIIGGDLVKSLSGGEMRRVSLGVQLVVVPKVLFLDEITSGLDSRNAGVVMDVCKDVAAAGTTMLVVIHQPSSNIFAMMDRLILLDHGRTMYQGPSSGAMDYFARKGHPMPANYNPADWLLQVSLETTQEELTKSGFFSEGFTGDSDDLEDETLSQTGSASSRISTTMAAEGSARPTTWTQVVEQLVRDCKTLVRDNNGLLLRTLCLGASSVLTAISFTNVGDDSLDDPVSFTSHVGAIFFLLLGSTIIMQLILFDFIEVRDLYIREIRTHQYNILSFGFTKVLIELITTFFQTWLVVLLTWWSLGLHGRIWYFFLVLYCLTLVNSSMSFLLGALPDDPRNAKEFIALLILPQLLFSGFFVDPESLPIWISWVSYLMPTFYAFKLVLADEFSTCTEYNEMAKDVVDCVESITNAFDGDFTLESLYSEDTSILLPEVGLFEGLDGTLEYLSFVDSKATPTTLFPNKCTIEGTNSLWYKSSSPGQCEFMLTSVQQAQFNPRFAADELTKDAPLINVVEGLKITYTPHDDLQGIDIEATDLYYPQDFFGVLIDQQMDSVGQAEMICETLQESCPDSWERDGFVDHKDCVAKMGALPVTTVNDKGQTVMDGNSTGCRSVHAALASKRDVHCPHISYLAEEDETGDVKCHESYNRSGPEFFDAEDYAIFTLVAAENNVNTTLMTKSSLTDPGFGLVSEKQTCEGKPDVSQFFRNVKLPSNYFCTQFLESQDATGAHDLAYWAVLVGLYVGIRSLSLFALRARARH